MNEVSEYARALGKLPKKRQYLKTCPVCGIEFWATARGVYDKESCKHRAKYARRKAEEATRTAAAYGS